MRQLFINGIFATFDGKELTRWFVYKKRVWSATLFFEATSGFFVISATSFELPKCKYDKAEIGFSYANHAIDAFFGQTAVQDVIDDSCPQL